MTYSKKRGLIFGIIIAAIAIPVGIYTIPPLFVNTEVNELYLSNYDKNG
jgi:hypothetical protein